MSLDLRWMSGNAAVRAFANFLSEEDARLRLVRMLADGCPAEAGRLVMRRSYPPAPFTRLPRPQPEIVDCGRAAIPSEFWLKQHASDGQAGPDLGGDGAGYSTRWSTLEFTNSAISFKDEGPVVTEIEIAGLFVERDQIRALSEIYASSSAETPPAHELRDVGSGMANAQGRCEEWLRVRLVGADPTTTKVETIQLEAMERIKGLSERAFLRAWGHTSPAFHFGKGGRKRRT